MHLIIAIMNKLNVSCFHLAGFLNKFDCLKLYRENLIQFNSNGVVFQCPGLFAGELIIVMEGGFQSMFVAIQSPNPDLELIAKVIYDLIGEKYSQCMFHFMPFCS